MTTVAVYVALCLIWGSTWLAITYVVRDVTPCTAAAARFWVAVALYFGLHAVRRIDFPPDWRTRLGIAAWGVPQIGLSYSVVYWAELHITSGMTAVLFATYPFVVAAVSARLIDGEGWTRAKLAGLICGTVGVAVVFVDQLRVASAIAAAAVVAVVSAACVCGVSIVYIKRYYNHCDTLALTGLQLIGGALALSGAAVVCESPTRASWTQEAVLATLYLAVFGSAIAFFGYYWLLKRIEGTTVATVTFVTPVIALFLGWLVHDEPLSPSLLVGGGLVVSGVWSVARSGRGRRRVEGQTAVPPDGPRGRVPALPARGGAIGPPRVAQRVD